MCVYSDRITGQLRPTETTQTPMILAVAQFNIEMKTRKGCPMQCIGECSCRPEPCTNECFCVSFCTRHC